MAPDERESPLPHPGNAERLHRYWVHGEGAAKIGWGSPGDFDRCVVQLQEHAHFTPGQAKGYCNLAHHAATGMWPAQHAEALGKKRFEDSTVEARTTSGSATDKKGDHGMTAVERRFTLVTVEARAGSSGEAPRIGGYAAMFNRPSQNLGGFVEVVERSFFNKARGDGWPDVMCRYNHDDNMLLGTTGAQTLRLSIDETGLDYDCTPPTSRGDVVELVQRGDVRKSSFAFRVPAGGEDWGLSDQGYPLRHLVTGQLVDVAPVNAPAYLDTTSALRSLAEKMEASVDEVRAAADANELRRFFKITSGAPMPKPKPKLLGAAAMMALLNRKEDPYVD